MKNELRGVIKQLTKKDGLLFSCDLTDYMEKNGFVRYCRPTNNKNVWVFWKDIETPIDEVVTTKCVGFTGKMFDHRYDKLVTATIHITRYNDWCREVVIDDDFEVIWERESE